MLLLKFYLSSTAYLYGGLVICRLSVYSNTHVTHTQGLKPTRTSEPDINCAPKVPL